MTLDLIGEANDYVGKGLSGGRLVVRPPENAGIVPENSIIVGNTVLYGAIAGECYFHGVAGERFAVRNSGALAVVEGTGDHGCEYMTGGIVVVLGRPAAILLPACPAALPMFWMRHGDFRQRCNLAMVDLEPVPEEEELLQRIANQSGDLESHGLVDVQGDMTNHDAERLFQLISNHSHYTASGRARQFWTTGRPTCRSSSRSCPLTTAAR